ncbi:MAG: HAD family hydrolase [Ktedonobacteraceae bacterium]|nr:HAD family hydrolase [Ktedonobacteraceae bacterium]MBV8822343.1 HAD family hydrolase [Ktedonobacteraceae bacterium]MBV9019923.1 HAD family hydrolase [Ktedonobacteraceae bacterium]
MATLVFLIDVDNTLLNNDEVKKDYDEHLQVELGPTIAKRFWELYEAVRKEKGIIDVPLTLQRLREETPLSVMDDLTYQHVHSTFDNYPFYKTLYPHALETLAYLATLGLTVIVSDGDLIFQAEKIVNSNLADAVDGRVLIYTHKQQHLADIVQRYPADHHVMIDDRPDILSDVKKLWKEHITTVFVRQGKYAATNPTGPFAPDITIQHIADLRNFSAQQFLR